MRDYKLWSMACNRLRSRPSWHWNRRERGKRYREGWRSKRWTCSGTQLCSSLGSIRLKAHRKLFSNMLDCTDTYKYSRHARSHQAYLSLALRLSFCMPSQTFQLYWCTLWTCEASIAVSQQGKVIESWIKLLRGPMLQSAYHSHLTTRWISSQWILQIQRKR